MCNTSLALGSAITITSTGGGVFVIQGENTKGIYGIELTITYDSSVFSAPTLKWGSLAYDADMHIANTTKNPIKVNMIRAEPFTLNDGLIATLTFTSQNSDCGSISGAGNIINGSSAYVPVQVSLAPGVACAPASDTLLSSKPGVPFSQPITTGDSTSSPPTTAATSTVVPSAAISSRGAIGLGGVAMPGESQTAKEERAPEAKAVTPSELVEPVEAPAQLLKPASAEKAADAPEQAIIKSTAYGSVLERFRTYQGAKTPEILTGLFTKAVSTSIHQSPAVVISDGKAQVRVIIEQSEIKGTSTNFALNGAKLVSLKKEDDSGKWLLDILPNRNVLTASISILNSNSMIDFPLTVVPPAGSVTGKKADFTTFLKDSSAQTPKYDLNGDGRHDYLDDYIYTAHFLLKSSASVK
jgi:hypothetical protein